MTVAEASDVLRQSEASLDRHIRLGHLEALRVGERGPLRLRAEAVEALLQPARPQTSEGDQQ